MLPAVIAVVGDIGAGKSAVARCMVLQYSYKRLPLAGRLKAMLSALGLSDSDLNGPTKESPSPLLLGKTPREAMQTLGTEWGRNLIDPMLWLSLWERDVAASKRVVVDDVRFPNEITSVRRMGGTVIRIVRPAVEFSRAELLHESERHQRGWAVDHTIINDGDLGDLYQKVGDLLWDIQEGSQSAGSVESAITASA